MACRCRKRGNERGIDAVLAHSISSQPDGMLLPPPEVKRETSGLSCSASRREEDEGKGGSGVAAGLHYCRRDGSEDTANLREKRNRELGLVVADHRPGLVQGSPATVQRLRGGEGKGEGIGGFIWSPTLPPPSPETVGEEGSW